MSREIFEAALGVASPWFVDDIDFERGSRFELPDVEGTHPVRDTLIKRYRHLNLLQYECVLKVRVPRVKLPDGAMRQVGPPWAGKLSGYTLLFESLVLMLAQHTWWRLGLSLRRP